MTDAATLLVVTGPPGSGKSTVSAALAELWEPSALVEGDAFFTFLRRGYVSPWLPGSHAQNDTTTRAAAAAAGTFARGGIHVVYDGVIGPWFLPGFAALTGLAAIDYVVLLPPVETCLHRVATRTGHGFTDLGAARHMHEEFARATAQIAPGTAPPADDDAPDATPDATSAGTTSAGTTPGVVLTDLPDDVAGVAEAIRAAVASGATRYTVAG
ncbi:AAA family ATPase [Promicromonospora sp. NPDC052451]|uniref:AAA family ATPase n=1 Tax=Promicromonospora sp. NPDC052451 TaxID=3364407 RepID=UPI0037C9D0BA